MAFAKRLLTWKAVAFATIFLLLILEWQYRFKVDLKPNSEFSGQRFQDWHINNGRQLLKKLSNGLSSTTTAPNLDLTTDAVKVKEENTMLKMDDDKSFGESGKRCYYNYSF